MQDELTTATTKLEAAADKDTWQTRTGNAEAEAAVKAQQPAVKSGIKNQDEIAVTNPECHAT